MSTETAEAGPERQAPRFGVERLRRGLEARSIAVVGASDRSAWSHMVIDNLQEWGYQGAVHLVNRRGASVRGQPSATSCEAIGEPVDVAILLVSNAATPDALSDAAAAGIGAAVVLGAGFAETGETGRAAQRELTTLAGDLDIALIGPNGVGFANLLDRVPAWVSPLPRPYLPGPVGVVSQSGNLGLTISNYAARHGVGVSHVVSTGNEVNVDVVDVMRVLAEDGRVRVIAIFAEAIRDPSAFLAGAARAAELGKPVVMLKSGDSTLAAEVAQTHTGALVGDAGVIAAALRSAGVVRVESIEQLVLTAGLLAHTGVLGEGGLGVVSISGGSNDIIADRAEALGVPLPELSPQTKRRVLDTVESLGVTKVMNPFDITGAAVGNFESIVDPLTAVGADPSVAILAWTGVPFAESPPMVETYPFVGQALRSMDRAGVLLLNTTEPIGAENRAVLEGAGVPYALSGIDRGVVAIRDAIQWSAWQRRRGERSEAAIRRPVRPPEAIEGVWDEPRALALLTRNGVPTMPWRLATNADAAVTAARELGLPVAVKIAARGLAHKTNIGGVALDVRDDDSVREAYERVIIAGAGRAVDGAIIAPMRSGGLELIVGVVRDPHWGLTLAVGLGGVYTELLADTALRLLPVGRREISCMLAELRGAKLLEGYRGTPAADLDAVIDAIHNFAGLAVSLPPEMAAMEINPLYVRGSIVEALDAVVEWSAQ